MNSKYYRLDSGIWNAIASMPNGAQLGDISAHADVAKEASGIAIDTGRVPSRIIDGRLQALKRRGIIQFSLGRWGIVKK